jgi:hypothetical protein
MALTRFSSDQSSSIDYVHGKDETVVVVAHGKTWQVSRITQRGEFLLGNVPSTLRGFGNNVSRHEVDVIHHLGQRVLRVAQVLLSTSQRDTSTTSCQQARVPFRDIL